MWSRSHWPGSANSCSNRPTKSSPSTAAHSTASKPMTAPRGHRRDSDHPGGPAPAIPCVCSICRQQRLQRNLRKDAEAPSDRHYRPSDRAYRLSVWVTGGKAHGEPMWSAAPRTIAGSSFWAEGQKSAPIASGLPLIATVRADLIGSTSSRASETHFEPFFAASSAAFFSSARAPARMPAKA